MVFDSSALDAAIDRGAERAFAFLSRLISAPSTVGSEGQALEVFATELEGMGFQTGKIFLPSDIGADPRAGVAQSIEGDRYDVLATLGPTSGPSLLLNGHIDVVRPTVRSGGPRRLSSRDAKVSASSVAALAT